MKRVFLALLIALHAACDDDASGDSAAAVLAADAEAEASEPPPEELETEVGSETMQEPEPEELGSEAAPPQPGDQGSESGRRAAGDVEVSGSAREQNDDGAVSSAPPSTLSASVELDAGAPQAALDAAHDAHNESGVDADLVMDAGDAPDGAPPADAAPDGDPEDAGALADVTGQADVNATDTSIEARLLSRLYACGAVGPGEFHLRPIGDEYARCLSECMIAAPCSDLRHYMCFEDAPEVLTCQAGCAAEPVTQPFPCGDGQIVWIGFVCDGLVHCANRADEEASCPRFTCANGSTVTGAARCDGLPLCADGSDEIGCASICLSPSI